MTFSRTLFKEFLSGIAPINTKEFQRVMSIFREMPLKKGATPIEMGKSSDLLLFVTKGILREYTILNNEDHTLWISSVGEAILDPGSFLKGSSSNISVEALVNSHALVTTKTEFVNLLMEIPIMSIITNVVYQQNLQEIREHMLLLREWPAQRREQLLFERKPHLFRKEIKRKHLASLLNVHYNSLSRISTQKSKIQE